MKKKSKKSSKKSVRKISKKINKDSSNKKEKTPRKLINFDKLNYLVQNNYDYGSKKYNTQDLKIKLAEKMNFSLNKFNIYFFNNLYESYFATISSIIKSFSTVSQKPHIISSNIEHPYIISILNDYKSKNIIDITFLTTNIYGSVTSDIESLIIPNRTCLIVVSPMNYLTGSLNNLKKIGELAHKNKIPMFSDCIFSIGKYDIVPDSMNMDCFTITFEKNNLSIAIMNKKLVEGYKIYDHDIRFEDKVQNFVQIDDIFISNSIQVLNNVFKSDIKLKNEKLFVIKNYFIECLQETLSKTHNNLYFYDEFIKKNINNNTPPKNNDIIILSHKDKKSLPHILSFIFINDKNDCEIYDAMKKNGIIYLKNDNYLLFESLGITSKWTKKIVSICFDETHSKLDINNIIKVFKTFIA